VFRTYIFTYSEDEAITNLHKSKLESDQWDKRETTSDCVVYQSKDKFIGIGNSRLIVVFDEDKYKLSDFINLDIINNKFSTNIFVLLNEDERRETDFLTLVKWSVVFETLLIERHSESMIDEHIVLFKDGE
jgi:hypothetical protein